MSGSDTPTVVLLSGGLGGARLAPALAAALGPGRLTVIANVGDDLTWCGLRICPDLDSILYGLAGVWDGARGWGRSGETFHVRDALAALGVQPWFNVGDRDLSLHLLRTKLLAEGQTLTEAARALAAHLGIHGVAVLPAGDAPAGTRLELFGGVTLQFQEWYVRERAQPAPCRVLLARGPAAPDALQALAAADVVIFGPSNPATSIGPILALDGMAEAVAAVATRIAVSPVVAGVAPANAGVEHHARARRLALAAEGCTDTPSAIALRYAGLAEQFVLDHRDAEHADAVRAAGLCPLLSDLLDAGALAQALARICTVGGAGRR